MYEYGNSLLPHTLLGLFLRRDEVVARETRCNTDLNYRVHKFTALLYILVNIDLLKIGFQPGRNLKCIFLYNIN